MTLRNLILIWLVFAAILGGELWSPPGGFRYALERKHAIAGQLRLTDPGDRPKSRARARAVNRQMKRQKKRLEKPSENRSSRQ